MRDVLSLLMVVKMMMKALLCVTTAHIVTVVDRCVKIMNDICSEAEQVMGGGACGLGVWGGV